MSSTDLAKLPGLIAWLGENAFFNTDLVEVKPSQTGGLGVFWKLGPEDDPEKDRLLLRVPKSNILSPKNSFIYSLLVDHESGNPSVDLAQGMHAMVATFIYEKARGRESPWFEYIASFSFENADIPLCLWSEVEKQALAHTECDLLNMLDPAELADFYWECVTFARNNETLVAIPEVLNSADLNEQKLHVFGQHVQAVIARAFTVDKYHGLSLVPGADLFNHLSPVELNEIIEVRENVHFECDDDDQLCEMCGEIGCPHVESEEAEQIDDIDEEEFKREFEQPQNVVQNDTPDSNETLVDEDYSIEESDFSQSDSESEIRLRANVARSEGDGLDPDRPITLSDIESLEMSDAETVQDDEEASTLSMSDGEYESEEETRTPAFPAELAQELSDGSKCCDIALAYLPNEKFDYELFNTYGNELANPYLLQRYGFVSPHNPNTSCSLTVQMYAEVKRMGKTEKAAKQMDLKLQWYEQCGFEVVNEVARSRDHAHNHESGSDDHDDSGSCEEVCCSGADEAEAPETWQLSPKISPEATPTAQTVALVRLMKMNFNLFYHKLYHCASERRLEKRIERYLLENDATKEEKAVMKRWVQDRLNRCNSEVEIIGERAEMARVIVEEEKALLARALSGLS